MKFDLRLNLKMERKAPVTNKENKTGPKIPVAGLKRTGLKSKDVEETKEEKPKTGLFTDKPSDRFKKTKAADPFSSAKKHKTNFGYVYSSGGVPCRINHGSVAHKIQWDTHPTCKPVTFHISFQFLEVDYDPLLINCFEGLLETDHPYGFVAYQSLIELLEAEGAAEKTIPVTSKLI